MYIKDPPKKTHKEKLFFFNEKKFILFFHDLIKLIILHFLIVKFNILIPENTPTHSVKPNLTLLHTLFQESFFMVDYI